MRAPVPVVVNALAISFKSVIVYSILKSVDAQLAIGRVIEGEGRLTVIDQTHGKVKTVAALQRVVDAKVVLELGSDDFGVTFLAENENFLNRVDQKNQDGQEGE